ncbi:MAG: hypothetical protein PF961_10795 [Planctomycetota bacterium]|jgi:hypothetical protein|nr:hypothetical protein [Planctomycetota bacterium]
MTASFSWRSVALCVVVMVAALGSEAPTPTGVWLECEQGTGHTRSQNFDQASGGKIVGWIGREDTTYLSLELAAGYAQARAYLRYNMERGEGAARLAIRPPEGEWRELGLLAQPATGSWSRFAWTDLAIGALPAGTWELALSGAAAGTGGHDALLLIDDQWHGCYEPPQLFKAGIAVDHGRVRPPLMLDAVFAEGNPVISRGQQVTWTIQARNRSSRHCADSVLWRLYDAKGEALAEGAVAADLASAAEGAYPVVLDRSLIPGCYRLDLLVGDMVERQRWLSITDQRAPGAKPNPVWLGMNMGRFTAEGPAPVIADLQAVGIRSARSGGNAADPRGYDPLVDQMLRGGLRIHWGLNYRGHDIDPAGSSLRELSTLAIDGPIMDEWFRRYRERCEVIMRHFSSPGAERIYHYIVGNEPDLKDAFTGLPGRPDVAVRLTQAAWEAAQAVNPGVIVVESPPTGSPDTPYLREMIVTHQVYRYCDVIGTHVYGGQTIDPRVGLPWQHLAEAGVRHPVACSESGVTQGWAHKAKTPGREWQTDYMALHLVKLKRMGYQWGILFTHDEDHHVDWAQLRAKGEIIQPNWNYVRDVLSQPREFRNGSFETGNDPRAVWVPDRNIDVQGWMETQFTWQASDQVYAGEHALRVNQGTWEWPLAVFQVVDEGITPGVPVTVQAMIRTTGHAPASLAICGYDRGDGDAQVSEVVSAREWQAVRLTVTPTNPWIVIRLGAGHHEDPAAKAWFDAVEVLPGE